MSITESSNYYKQRYRTFVIRLNREKDAALVAHLESVDNISAYICGLLLQDLKGQVITNAKEQI